MSTERRQDEVEGSADNVDPGGPPPEPDLDEWLELLRAQADDSVDVGSRAFRHVLALVLALLGLLALFALVLRLLES